MFRTFATTACLLLLILPLGADNGKSKAKGHHKGNSVRANVEIFIPGDRRMIREYIHVHHGGLPPGLAKRHGNLPPGLEKQLRRKGHLPPGLEKRIYYFPPELECQLAPLSPGLRRGFIAGRAVIVNSRTSVVVDVFIP